MRRSLLMVLLLGFSAAAHAQSRTPSFFVEGAAFDDHDVQRSRSASDVMGGALSVGVRVSPHFSIRFDAERPAFHTVTYLNSSASFRFVEKDSFRTGTYVVNFAGHIAAGNVIDVSLLAGLGRTVQESRLSGFEEYLNRDGSVARHEDIDNHYLYRGVALTFGTDIAVRLTPHLAIVPELRAHLFSEYQSTIRAKMALRWTF
jgi:hypothetical protein